MCGIAGILSHKPDPSDALTRAKAMQSALHHRGPDGSGLYQSSNATATLIHTRLSIIDLSDTGHQPMAFDDQQYWITFNGEIYNYKELKRSLELEGVEFQSHSDTEVILALYKRHSEKCVEYLRGMYAFLIWDEKSKTAFAARDPLGIKPFYYQATEQHFIFSSELRALHKANNAQASLSYEGVSSYLHRGSVSEPQTLVEGINILPAGSFLKWQNGELTNQSFWKINFSDQITEKSEAAKITRQALLDSVKAHFVSDVPVGLFLSGGIDSTAILALAHQVTDQPLNTYSIAFENPQWNEGDIARKVAKHFGANHTEFVMTPEIAEPLFKSFLETIDQPTIDGFNTYCVSKLAHDHGEKVVLSGLGGDELFAGYKSFDVLPKTMRILKLASVLTPLVRIMQTPLNRLLSPRFRRALDSLCDPTSLTQAHQSLRGIFSTKESEALLSSFVASSPKSSNEPKPAWVNESILDQISALELSTYMRNQLLRDSDIMSMAWSLELRVPFVDKNLIEALSPIASDIRLRQGKKLLLEAVPEIPEWVSNRPKQGFRFPFDEWFSGYWNSISPNHNIPSWIKLSPWYRRWSIVVLEDWINRHLSQGKL